MSKTSVENIMSNKILKALKKHAPLTMQGIAEKSGVGVANVRRTMLGLMRADQVREVGAEVGEPGQRNLGLWAPAGWTPSYDANSVRHDLIPTLLGRLSRRVGETDISLAAELNVDRASIRATLDHLAADGRVTASRVSSLSCYRLNRLTTVAV